MSRRADRDQLVEAAVAANFHDLLAYAERRVENRADAADALGDALEIVWRRSRKVPADPSGARKFLFVVVRNVLLNAGRSNRRRTAAVQRLRVELEAVQAAEVDVRLDVAAAIAALPEEHAELVRLVHWDGFSIADSADLLGLNPSTARSRYATARATLRTALEEREEIPR